MSLFAIFGDPVDHSFSPKIHNAAFLYLHLYHHRYIKKQITDPKILRETFFSLGLQGANVTVPHKEVAFLAADEVRGVGKKIGAINTLVLEDGRLIGYNTDALGFFYNISSYGNFENILILGAGGTAKAVATVLKDKDKKVTITNRSENRLEFFKDLGFVTASWNELVVEEYDLVINTTSAGLKDDNLPVPEKLLYEILEKKPFCADVIYGKETPFLNIAKKKKLPWADGSGMLIWQGVLAFEKFVSKVDKEEIFPVMKKAFYL